MNTTPFINIISTLENELELLKFEIQDKFLLTEKAVALCENSIQEFRKIVIKGEFQKKEDEIIFFKHLKPKVNSKLVFYIRLFEIETHRLDVCKSIQIKYLKSEAKKINQYFEDNLEFCQYYWRKQSYLDHIYFIRGNTNIRIHPDNLINLVDPKFSTAYDQTVANIIANEKLVKYIENELHKLKHGTTLEKDEFDKFSSPFHWDRTNTDAVELIYALFYANSVRGRKMEIKDLVGLFEKMFNLQLGDFYHTFQEIQRRKKDKTKFLNSLIDALNKRMDDLDA